MLRRSINDQQWIALLLVGWFQVAVSLIGLSPLREASSSPTRYDNYVVCRSSCSLGRGGTTLGMSDSSQSSLDQLLTSRLPTSADDQVRQAAASLHRATTAASGTNADPSIHRHVIRLLLPVIGATELDDWPGGSRQQMEAACPLVESILQQQQLLQQQSSSSSTTSLQIQKQIIDESDGVAALMAQSTSGTKDDSCTILLPTADTIQQSVQRQLESSVGPGRNLILVNPQYRRRSDFGGLFAAFGGGASRTSEAIDYVEQYHPTFSLTNLICEGESVRVLRTYPGPWRVFIREEDNGVVDWKQIGSKEFIATKPSDWEQMPANQRDGGALWNYGQPSYQDIVDLLYSSPNFTPKSPAERAAAAFTFIKDTL